MNKINIKNIRTIESGKGIAGTVKKVDQDEENFFLELEPTIYRIPIDSVEQDLTKLVGKQIKIGNFGQYAKDGTFQLIVS